MCARRTVWGAAATRRETSWVHRSWSPAGSTPQAPRRASWSCFPAMHQERCQIGSGAFFRLPRREMGPLAGSAQRASPPSCSATSGHRDGATRSSVRPPRIDTHGTRLMSQTESSLARNLRNRHIQLIALGGTIGVGLFLGSAKAIHEAGPGLLIGYAVGGVAIFFIMRALGELLTYRPVAGSFATYAEEFCGPLPGFITGWSYWFAWVATVMAEITAIGIYVGYWLPGVPQWLPSLIALLVLYATNLLAVGVFGELELWFALIKVVPIVGLILAGLSVILFHVGSL